ncbi:hypothetical protein OR1_02765 [Geobacter sp. OR-1]|uniref:hypothetical protein n=1 Tax=Geobacter sp. OR-1 TaxID=1266765 RepID=UPI000543CFAD|nr:hypothetical protein [Geobacter sp. OR-1]GAM10476.1 hypothetical protein OR1_02765 [Geobacter sp. OR-1]
MNEDLTPDIKVGIYWFVDKDIVGKAVALKDAEPYGDALQYGGHYEFWERLHAGNKPESKFKSHAYDYYPRGRLVYFPKRQMARLYVDRCLDDDIVNTILDFFEHDKVEIEIVNDEHYSCASCNRHYME